MDAFGWKECDSLEVGVILVAGIPFGAAGTFPFIALLPQAARAASCSEFGTGPLADNGT